VSTSGVRDWVAEIETLFSLTTQHLADGRSRLSREENYQVVRTSPHAFTCLQSLHLVTLGLMFIEPANSLYIVVYSLIVYLVIILNLITEKY